MNAVTRKLNSRSGISLAISLVFFLLCAMVGAVVMSAASVSAGNTARERQLYRETQALTSAADLLSQDIQAMTFTGSYSRTETVTTTVDSTGNTGTSVATDVKYAREAPKLEGSTLFGVTKKADGTYTDHLNLTQRFYMNQSVLSDGTPAQPAPQTISFGAVEAQNIPEVTGSITVEEDYTLTVVLRCGENSLTMSFPPHVDSHTEVGVPQITNLSDTVTQKTTTAVYSTTVCWGHPLMKEGGADHA